MRVAEEIAGCTSTKTWNRRGAEFATGYVEATRGRAFTGIDSTVFM